MNPAGEWKVRASLDHGFADAPAELLARGEADAVLFEGSLLGRDQLESDLGLSGSETDAEIALAASRRWGDSVAEHLPGVHTLVTWDGTERRLQAVRDPLGIQPLFVQERGEAILISNSLEELRRDPASGATPSAITAAALIARRMPDQRETWYPGVERIPQGHAWTLRGGRRATVRRYWDPRSAAAVLAQDLVESVDQLLETTVDRSIGDEPLGVWLSGGVDSMAVAAYASRPGRRPLTLSLVVPGEQDDGTRQRISAERLGLPHMAEPLSESGGESPLDAALSLAAGWPAPLLDPWTPGFLRLNERAVASGVHTVLTGNGGDAWLATPFVAADLLRGLRFGRLVAYGRTTRRSYRWSNRQAAVNLLWRFGIRPLLVDALGPPLGRRAAPALRLRLQHMLPGWLAPERALRRELLERPTASFASSSGQTVHGRVAAAVFEHPLQDASMEELFEIGRRTGVRLVHPLCDTGLLEHCFGLQPEDLDFGGRPKGLLRAALARRFPALDLATLPEPQIFDALSQLVVREAPRLLRRLGGVPSLADMGVVDEAAFGRAVRDRTGSPVRVWNALVLESWLRPRC